MDKNSQIFTKGLQSKYGTNEYVQEMQELKFELDQNKETNRPSIFTSKEKMQAINLLAKQKADLEKQVEARNPKNAPKEKKVLNEDIKNALRNNKGGSITKNRIGGNDYRKGGYVLSTVDNRKKK